jgi:hypothetical protein
MGSRKTAVLNARPHGFYVDKYALNEKIGAILEVSILCEVKNPSGLRPSSELLWRERDK